MSSTQPGLHSENLSQQNEKEKREHWSSASWALWFMGRKLLDLNPGLPFYLECSAHSKPTAQLISLWYHWTKRGTRSIRSLAEVSQMGRAVPALNPRLGGRDRDYPDRTRDCIANLGLRHESMGPSLWGGRSGEGWSQKVDSFSLSLSLTGSRGLRL
jgi:hypothetical protein